MAVADLMDRGIEAYLAGRQKDARAAFREVLRLEPGNARARTYLDKLGGAAPPTASTAGARAAGRPRAPTDPAVAHRPGG